MAKVMFIGGMPGRGESQDRPYRGKAGKLLDQLLDYIGLSRDEVTVTNLFDKKMPADTDPEDGLTLEFWNKLKAEQPDIIVTLGHIASKAFIPEMTTMESVERVPVQFGGRVIFPMRQPSAILAEEKGEASGRNAKIVGNNFLALERLIEDGPAIDHILGRPGNYYEADAKDIAYFIQSAGWVALDIEWFKDGELACVTLSNATGRAIYVGTDQHLLNHVDLFLQTPGVEVVTWNGLGDLRLLNKYGVNFEIKHDGMTAAWVLQLATQGLKANAREWCGMEMKDFKEVFSDGFEATPEGIAYACRDADATLRATRRLVEEVDRQGLRPVYDMAMECFNVVLDMMRHGVLVDRERLATLDKYLEEKIDEAIKIFERCGGSVEAISSFPKLSKLLFEELHLPTSASRRGKTGWSTDAAVLAKLRGMHPVVDAISPYRKFKKLRSTYVITLPNHIMEDGRIHTTLKIEGTETGRPSAENPNLLNQPVRTEDGRKVRNCFISRPGYKLMSVDLSQIQLRVLADVSRDPGMRLAFIEGADIHTATAADVLHKPASEVTPEERFNAKTLNFGLAFLMGPQGFLDALAKGGVDLEAEEYDLDWATGFINRYFASRPGVKSYQERTIKQATEDLFIIGPSGRRRWAFELLANFDKGIFNAGSRQVVNMPMQDGESFIMWRALIELRKRLKMSNLDAKMWLQMYDAIDLEVKDEDVEETARLVVDVMCNTTQLHVPIVAEVEVGTHWGSMKKLELLP